MSEHTKEPWNPGFLDDEYNVCADSDGRVICTVKRIEDRRRIVACVNACIGYSTEDLERFGRFISSGEAEGIKQQRDKLLTAASAIRAHMVGSLPTQGWLRDNDQSRAALGAICEAVAEIEAAK